MSSRPFRSSRNKEIAALDLMMLMSRCFRALWMHRDILRFFVVSRPHPLVTSLTTSWKSDSLGH
eukprot:4913150-Pyramimonas_sp.AAC.1